MTALSDTTLQTEVQEYRRGELLISTRQTGCGGHPSVPQARLLRYRWDCKGNCGTRNPGLTLLRGLRWRTASRLCSHHQRLRHVRVSLR